MEDLYRLSFGTGLTRNISSSTRQFGKPFSGMEERTPDSVYEELSKDKDEGDC
jgi:hypothetical protein